MEINWWVVLVGIYWLSAGLGSLGNGDTKEAFETAFAATVITFIIFLVMR